MCAGRGVLCRGWLRCAAGFATLLDMRDETRAVRYGHQDDMQPGDPLHPSPVFAATYFAPGDPADSPRNYGRSDNPNWRQLEAAIAALEGGPTIVFASGMAAAMGVFGPFLRPGDAVVMPTDGYFFCRSLVETYFAEMGVTVLKAPTADDAQSALIEEPGVKLLWLESPSNPELTVCDLAAMTKAARAKRILVAHDNTTATAFAQKPLKLGADFSVASDTKATSGHSDLVLGHVSCRNQMLADQVRNWRTLTGAVPGPMETWLALRSMATAALRIERQSENALAIAEFLAGRAEVERVYYPGLASHPRHELAAAQMKFFGGVVSFTLRDEKAAERFFTKAKLVTEATSFGGVTTTAERRARWGGDDVAPGFIRMSVGCEAVEDLIEDIGQALE